MKFSVLDLKPPFIVSVTAFVEQVQWQTFPAYYYIMVKLQLSTT